MRKAQKDPQKWLTSLVKTMMSQMKIWDRWNVEPIPKVIFQVCGNEIKRRLLKMSPATRGEIADLGSPCKVPGKVDELYCGYYIYPQSSGRDIVTAVAVATIIARMYELLQQKDADREDRFWRDEPLDPVQEQHNATGRGSIGHQILLHMKG